MAKNVKSCVVGELPIVHLRSFVSVVYSGKYIVFMHTPDGLRQWCANNRHGGLKSQMSVMPISAHVSTSTLNMPTCSCMLIYILDDSRIPAQLGFHSIFSTVWYVCRSSTDTSFG